MSKRTKEMALAKKAADTLKQEGIRQKGIKSNPAILANRSNVFTRNVNVPTLESNDFSETTVIPNWEWNRPYDPSSRNTKVLRTSMKLEGFRPNEAIMVNTKGWITSGNHRYHVAKELGIPYYYFISDAITKYNIILKSNQGKNWTVTDTFNLWVKHKKPVYVAVETLRAKYSFPIYLAILVCKGTLKTGGHFTEQVKHGNLDISQRCFTGSDSRAKRISDIIYRDYFTKNQFNKISYFQRAVLNIILHEKYDHGRMSTVLVNGAVGNITKVSNIDGWVAQLLDLYNNKLPAKRRIIIQKVY